MTCDCNDSKDLRAQVEAFKAQVDSLKGKVKNLEDKNASINDDCNEAQNNAELAEKERDDAEDAKDQTRKDLQVEKGKYLEMLHRLEFPVVESCCLCGGIRTHQVGCNMRLEIFRLSMELNRSGILRVGRVW